MCMYTVGRKGNFSSTMLFSEALQATLEHITICTKNKNNKHYVVILYMLSNIKADHLFIAPFSSLRGNSYVSANMIKPKDLNGKYFYAITCYIIFL